MCVHVSRSILFFFFSSFLEFFFEICVFSPPEINNFTCCSNRTKWTMKYQRKICMSGENISKFYYFHRAVILQDSFFFFYIFLEFDELGKLSKLHHHRNKYFRYYPRVVAYSSCSIRENARFVFDVLVPFILYALLHHLPKTVLSYSESE